jgi:glycopeptide antibiotics resistance protein
MTKPNLRFTVFLAAVYLLALAMIAFWPTPVDRPVSGSLTSIISWLHAHGMPSFIGYNKIEFGANILLFTPLGYILAAWTRKWWHPLAAGFAASCLIELGQALLLPNRFASPLDIVANTTGAALGIVIHVILHGRRAKNEPKPRLNAEPDLGTLPGRKAAGNHQIPPSAP